MSVKKMPSVTKESVPQDLAETELEGKIVQDSSTQAVGESPTQTEVDSEASKKKAPTLTPAPLPTKSPWKSVATSIPVSNIPVESLEANKKKKNKTTTPVGSGTKWVPMKASIVVSGSKRSGNGGKKSPPKGNGNSNNNQKANNAGSKKKKQQGQSLKRQQQKTSNNAANGPSTSDDKITREASQDDRDTSTKKNGSTQGEVEKDSQNEEQQSNTHHQPSDKLGQDGSSFSSEGLNFGQYDGPQMHNQQQNRKQNQFQHYPFQQNNLPRRRHYNTYNEAFKQQNFAPFPQQKGSYTSYQGHIPRTLNNGYHLSFQQPDQASPMYHPYYTVQPMIMAINSIAQQIEYYFSAENLNKDNYLRSKLSKEGYAPLSLIAKFYRVVNLSFGGDANLILAALREIAANESAAVEIALGANVNQETSGDHELSLAQYFIRSKDWSSLLPDTFSTVVEIEKTLTPDSLEEIVINLPTSLTSSPAHDSTLEPAYDDTNVESFEKDPALNASTGGSTQVKNQ